MPDWYAIPDSLLSEFAAGNVLIFVGAGFSIPAGFPGWKSLLLAVAELGHEEGAISTELKGIVERFLQANAPAAHELDAAAQLLDDAVDDETTPIQFELVEMLKRCLVPRVFPLPVVMERRLEILRELPCKAILSTNYNPLLRGVTPFDERALSVYRSVLRSDVEVIAGDHPHAVAASDEHGLHYVSIPRPVVQIHGNLNNSQSVVLSREGYRRLLFACPNYMTFIRSCFATRTILFVGFSFSDAYINELRSEVASLCGTDGPPLAYAIMNDVSQIECKFRLEHEGTRVITWDTKAPEGWGGFERIWAELRDKLRAAAAARKGNS